MVEIANSPYMNKRKKERVARIKKKKTGTGRNRREKPKSNFVTALFQSANRWSNVGQKRG